MIRGFALNPELKGTWKTNEYVWDDKDFWDESSVWELTKVPINRAVVFDCDGYEALYIDGELKETGHPLEEGTERVVHFLELESKYGIKLREYQFLELPEQYHEKLKEYGNWENNISAYGLTN